MHCGLVRMRIEAVEREAHDRDARVVRREPCRDLAGAAKGMGRKLRRDRGRVLEPPGRDEDVAFDLQDARERRIAGLGRVAREARVAHELLRLVQRDAAAASGERSHSARPDDNAIGGVALRRRKARERSPQPARVEVFGGGRGRVPDLDRAEMRQVRIGVADALHDCELAGEPYLAQRREGRVQADMGVEVEEALARDREPRPQPRVERIAEGHHGVEAVVAAAQLDEHEELARVARRRGKREAPHPGERNQRGEGEKGAAIDHARVT